MSSNLGSPLTLRQAKSIGVSESFQPFGTNSGDGIFNQTGGETNTEAGDVLTNLGTDDFEVAGLNIPYKKFLTGRFVATCCWETNFEPGDNAHTHYIGFRHEAGTNMNRAVFEPNVGQNTDGNVKVQKNKEFLFDNAEAVGTASVEYPPLTEGTILTSVVVDRDRDVTEFYVETNPLVDTPDATINLVPDLTGSVMAEAIRFSTATSSNSITISWAGYRYIP